MRQYREFTARNLLRKPLVLGVPLFGLLGLSFIVLTLSIILGTNRMGNLVTLSIGALGYGLLRVFTRFGKPGWEEALLYRLECWIKRHDKKIAVNLDLLASSIVCESPDTLDETQLILAKDSLLGRIEGIKPGATWSLVCQTKAHNQGVKLYEVVSKPDLSSYPYTYSLWQLPVTTDPLWLFWLLSRINGAYSLLVTFKGVDALQIKKRIELSRRASSKSGDSLVNIDSEVTFAESSQVLEGISRGDESIVEVALTVVTENPQQLDPSVFAQDIHPRVQELARASALGLRPRFYRSHLIRSVTATDLIPNFVDPYEDGPAILKTVRGNLLYFKPNDERLEALHWLVVGASGSGKSFFTGLVLDRMRRGGEQISVLFLDHNRSFRRFVNGAKRPYLEPKTLSNLDKTIPDLFDQWNTVGSVSGIELSDLDLNDKKAAAFKVLSTVETFLRFRETTHPVYVVLDECWQWMRDEPVMVQRAFREYRKLNGAVIAITQSLSDFVTDQSGQSIFQNAPVRILLRQGEDLTPFQGMLGLNSVELAKTRFLKQVKGEFSECLIKTPFLSRLGRLYPTPDEYQTFRTDNLRQEFVEEARTKRRNQHYARLT